MKQSMVMAFLLLLSLSQGCKYVKNLKGDKQAEPAFAISPKRILATDVGLSTTIRISRPEDYDPEKIRWRNTSPTVVKLDNGKVYAKSSGKATIIVSYEGKDNWKDTCHVEVQKDFKLIENVDITPQHKKFTQVGQEIQLNAKVTPENATQDVQWKSLHPNIAEVDGTGRVTAVSQGKAKIIATSYLDTTQTDTATVELEVKNEFTFTAIPGLRKRQESFGYVLKQVKKQVNNTGFYVTPGNLDPITEKYKAFRNVVGNSNSWYPAVDYYMLPDKGHEDNKHDNIKWLRNYFSVLPAITNPGPPKSPTTIYSFDYGKLHVIVINPFFNGQTDIREKAAFSASLYDWLRKDLNTYAGRYNFVVSGVPAFPGDNASSYGFASENDREQLWQLLNKHGVIAYITGGNKVAMKKHQGIWQLSTGNGQHKLSFINVRIQSSRVVFERYSGQLNGIFKKVETHNAMLSDYL